MVRATLAFAALAASASAFDVTFKCITTDNINRATKNFVRYSVNGVYVDETVYCNYAGGAAINAVSGNGVCTVGTGAAIVDCVFSGVTAGTKMLFQTMVGSTYEVTAGTVTATNTFPAGTTTAYTTLEGTVSAAATISSTALAAADFQSYLLIDGAEVMGTANGTVVSKLATNTQTAPTTFNWVATNTTAYWQPPVGSQGLATEFTAMTPQAKTSLGIAPVGPVVDSSVDSAAGDTAFTATILSADTTFGVAELGLIPAAADSTSTTRSTVTANCAGQKTCTVEGAALSLANAIFPLVGGFVAPVDASVCRSRCVFPASSTAAVACAQGTTNGFLPAGVTTCGANFFPVVTQACDGIDNGVVVCTPGSAANLVVTDVEVATTIALIGTNTTAFGLYIAQLNAAGYATVFSRTCVACVARPIFKGTGGFITCGACALAGAVVGVTTRQAVVVGSSSAVAVGVCNPGTAAQQAACLAEMNCQGFSFTSVTCSQGTCPTCPVEDHSSSKKGLLGLLGLLALIPIVLLLLCSSCLLCAMLMKRRKTVAVPTPMPTVAPLATVCEPAVVCGGSTFVGHTSPYGADPFCAAPVADPFVPGVGSAYPVM